MGWNEWVRTAEIEPSLYAADFSRLGEQIETVMEAGVRIFHFDVGDGHFVEPITIGPIVMGIRGPIRMLSRPPREANTSITRVVGTNAAPAASAPTGGGTNRSDRNHHRHPTRFDRRR